MAVVLEETLMKMKRVVDEYFGPLIGEEFVDQVQPWLPHVRKGFFQATRRNGGEFGFAAIVPGGVLDVSIEPNGMLTTVVVPLARISSVVVTVHEAEGIQGSVFVGGSSEEPSPVLIYRATSEKSESQVRTFLRDLQLAVSVAV